jgi:hypothetical protein
MTRNLLIPMFAGALLLAGGARAATIPAAAQRLIETTYASPTALHQAALAYAQSSVDAWTAAKVSGQHDSALSLKAAEAHSCLAARIERLSPDADKDWQADFISALTSTPEMADRRNVANELSTGESEVPDTDEPTACKAAGVR